MGGGGDELGAESQLLEPFAEPHGAVTAGGVLAGVGANGREAQEIHPFGDTGRPVLGQPLVQIGEFQPVFPFISSL